MASFTVIGIEEVYDAFDEFEHSNLLQPITVYAESVTEAMDKGRRLLQDGITKNRRAGGFMPTGMFLAEIEQVLDIDNRVLYSHENKESTVVYEAPPSNIEIYSAVSEELLQRLAEFPEERFRLKPQLFEETVAELLVRMGYKVHLTPQSGDDGRDIMAAIDSPTAPILMLVECKRYAKHRLVGPFPIARIWSRLFDDWANIGMIITTSDFEPVSKRTAGNRGYQLSLKNGLDFIGWVRELRGK